MHKRLSFIFAMLLLGFGLSAAIPITQLRYQYVQAVEDGELTNKLLKKLEAEHSNEALRVAYIGGLQALVAKHSWNPYNKMEYLRISQLTLARAVRLDPEDPEIRFLRFSVQHYIPAFLGYSKNLVEDKEVIVRNLYKADPQVRKVIANFMLESGRCTASEEKQMKALI